MSKYYLLFVGVCSFSLFASDRVKIDGQEYVLQAGHESLREWRIPASPEFPKANPPTLAKIELGRRLFFDKQLSVDRELSCGSCHNPEYGWSDGLATAKGFKEMVLPRATPTIINVAYNPIQNWDGRNETLEAQATEPITHPDEMHLDMGILLERLQASKAYRAAFKQAFPDEVISKQTVAKAIAAFERTVISKDTPFDRWVKGDKHAMNKKQIEGFKVFIDPKKGDCRVCHSGPNFTDNSFHNIGLQSFLSKKADLGRYKVLPLPAMKGAFKTPTLRSIALTAPYFHDGSGKTLQDVVEHYQKGGMPNAYLSKNMKSLSLTDSEQEALIEFMHALTGEVNIMAGGARFSSSDLIEQ